MEGITILHEYTAGGPDIGCAILAGLVSLAILAVIIFAIYLRIKKAEKFSFGTWIVLSLALFGIIAGFIGSVKRPSYTEYMVLLDNNIRYVEFTNTYEVIKQEGEIYTIREIIND